MDQLFGSKTRVKLLQLFMQNPNRAFYVREITRKVDEQINSVRRELANLLNIGILSSRNKDNKVYYEVKQDFEHYQALRALFAGVDIAENTGAVTNTGMEATLKALGSVELLAFMGVFTGENKTGVDLLIVGDVNKTNVNNYVADLEDEEDREISYAVMTLGEFNYRKDVHDRFITLVADAKKNVVHDPHGLLTSTTKKKTTTKRAKRGKK